MGAYLDFCSVVRMKGIFYMNSKNYPIDDKPFPCGFPFAA